MPYHPDSTTEDLFIEQHLQTPEDITEVICSICRQRCGSRHVVVQISDHSACQCVFGITCILQWLRSDSASSNTCPSCKAVLYNPKREEEGSQLDSDSEGDDKDEFTSSSDNSSDDSVDESLDGFPDDPSDIDLYPAQSRGRTQGPQVQNGRHRRGTAPSPPPTLSSSSGSDTTIPSRQPRTGRQTVVHEQERDHNRRPRRQPSLSSFTSTASSRTLSASSTHSTASTSSTSANAAAIANFVDDLWAGTWDLVTEAWDLTPPHQTRSRSITRAQLVKLILNVHPFEDELDDGVGGATGMLLERLVLRARKMVNKHRKNGFFDEDAELRTEREDVELAVEFGM